MAVAVAEGRIGSVVHTCDCEQVLAVVVVIGEVVTEVVGEVGGDAITAEMFHS